MIRFVCCCCGLKLVWTLAVDDFAMFHFSYFLSFITSLSTFYFCLFFSLQLSYLYSRLASVC